jgi:hypothetical protein
MASLERIERALTGKDAGAPRLARDQSGRYRLGAGSVRSSSRPGLKTTPTGPPLQVTLLNEADVVTQAPKVRRTSRWLLVAGVLALGLGGLAVRAVRSGLSVAASGRSDAGSSSAKSVEKESVEKIVLPPAQAEPPAAPSAMPSASAVAVEVAAGTLKATTRARPRAVAVRLAAAAPASAAPPVAAVSAPTTAKKPKAAEAWDPNSFGPRR